MSLLARLIAKEEGFGLAGTLPTRNHNPGDLRHSPHSVHSSRSPDAIGAIDTDAHGWEDLERQLQIDVGRHWTLRQLIEIYAPPNENDTEAYLAFICKGGGWTPETLVAVALRQAPPGDVESRVGDVEAINTGDAK